MPSCLYCITALPLEPSDPNQPDKVSQKSPNVFPTPPQRKERDAAGGRPPRRALSFGVGWGTHSETFEKPCQADWDPMAPTVAP